MRLALPARWIEEPVHPLDFDLHGEVAALSRLPLATGENIFSHDDARNLLRYGGLRRDRDVLQFDISLSYGIVEYRAFSTCSITTIGRARAAHRMPVICSLRIASQASGSASPRSRWTRRRHSAG